MLSEFDIWLKNIFNNLFLPAKILFPTKGYLTSVPVSKPALEKHLITTNSSCVRLNFLTWDSNSCPLIHFMVSIRSFEESLWRSETIGLDPQPISLCSLQSAKWYHLKVIALSTAGSTTATYYFSTLTEAGGMLFIEIFISIFHSKIQNIKNIFILQSVSQHQLNSHLVVRRTCHRAVV